MSESSCQGTVARPTFPVQRAVASTVALTQAASGTLRANKFIEECAESLANDRPGRPDESGAREADAKATRASPLTVEMRLVSSGMDAQAASNEIKGL